jgi:uncharacterized membrane protein YphA (DoxX/SURF4 family)
VVDGSVAGWLAGAALGVVLLVAGIAKRVDRRWPAAAAALGAPAWTATVLPWVEIALGALLVAGLARPYPAIATAVLLVLFTVLLVVNLVRGRTPPCACFGTRSREPSSAASVVRNIALLALAGVAIVA